MVGLVLVGCARIDLVLGIEIIADFDVVAFCRFGVCFQMKKCVDCRQADAVLLLIARRMPNGSRSGNENPSPDICIYLYHFFFSHKSGFLRAICCAAKSCKAIKTKPVKDCKLKIIS